MESEFRVEFDDYDGESVRIRGFVRDIPEADQAAILAKAMNVYAQTRQGVSA
jgi:hypothetical protein